MYVAIVIRIRNGRITLLLSHATLVGYTCIVVQATGTTSACTPFSIQCIETHV